MTAQLHEVWSHTGPLTNCYEISAEGLGTAMV